VIGLSHGTATKSFQERRALALLKGQRGETP
jgi:hypothetical protein